MKGTKNIFGLISAVIMLVLTAAGCGFDNRVTLNIYNWGDYIEKSVLKEFEKEYKIKVNYETFTTNEDMYVKVNSGGSSYDVAIPSDYMISRMINEDLLLPIDMKDISNYKYIEERFKNLDFDPDNKYSVPYMWGTVGILYNKTMVTEPVDSWKILWDKKYNKQVLMYDSLRDSLGVTLKMLGFSMNTRNKDELEAAGRALIEQKPIVLSYVVDDVKEKMIAGEAALAVAWSGDAYYCIAENPDLEYVIPKEGTNLWFDSMVIPKTSKHKREAELFIDFMCRPEIAFKNADYIGYASPHSEAKKMLDPELVNDRSAYPEEEDLVNCEIFLYLGDFVKEYDDVWTRVKAY